MSADILQTQTATAIAQAVSAGQGRIEAITRSFATGVKELFGIVHALTLKNATSAEKAKINNAWVTVDPREWTKRTGMVITVGLGTGTRESRVHQLTQLAGMQAQGLQIGICKPENLYNTGVRITQEMGYRAVDDFWTDPAKQPPQPPQPNPLVQAEQIKAQSAQAIAAAKGQADMQIQAAHAQATAAGEQARTQADIQIQMQKVQSEYELELAKAKMQLEIQDMQHSREQQNALEIARIQSMTTIEAARIKAGAGDGQNMVESNAAQVGQPDAPDATQQMMTQILAHLAAPKRIVRDQMGRAVGVETVTGPSTVQ